MAAHPLNRPLLLIVLLGLAGLAFGQDAAADASADAPKKTFSVNATGDHQFVDRFPVGVDAWNSDYSGDGKAPQFRSTLGLEVKEGTLGAVTRWQLDSILDTAAGTHDPWTAMNRARNLESYVVWNPDAFRLAFGLQVYNWGVADGRNPTDNLNPRDYTVLGGAKIPVLSANVTWYPTDEVSVQAVYVPQPVDSIAPVDPRTLLIGYGFPTTYAAKENRPQDFIAGGKVNLLTEAADLSFSYLYDWDAQQTPVVQNASFGSGTTITLVRKRVQRFGADVKTTIDRYGLWAEGAYTLTGNQDPNNDAERLSRWDYTLGVDFSYGPQDASYLNLQYTGTVIPGYDASKNTETVAQRYYEKSFVAALGGEREGLVQGLTWNAHWNLADSSVVPTLTGAYSLPFYYDDSAATRYGNLVLKPEIDFIPVDSFHITMGASLAYAWIKKSGASDLTLDTVQDGVGLYTPANQVFVKVAYQWNYELSR